MDRTSEFEVQASAGLDRIDRLKPELQTETERARPTVAATMRWTSGLAPAGSGRHIVILVENLPVPFDRRPWQIAQTLLAAGHHVSVICPAMYDFTARRERLAGVDIHRYPSREGSTAAGWIIEYLNALFWMTWLCVKLFLTRGIDAIHACNPPDLLFLVAWPLRVFFGVRFVFDHHDLGPEVYEAKFNRRDAIYKAMVALERMTYRLADVALATNQSFKSIAIQRDGKRADRIYIVRNAPMPGRLFPGAPRKELLAGHAHLVVYLGVMNKQDGLDLLLQSAAHVVRQRGRKDVVFALIGDGPELAPLKALAGHLSLNGQVQFLGRISDGRIISDYLNTASVCVCPDPKNPMNDHSTMTKVVEYMALGRAIVAYDLKETLYSAGPAALYATNNDPGRFADLIVRLLDDERERQWLGQCAQSRYEQMLSWTRSQDQLLAAYAKVFDPRARSAEAEQCCWCEDHHLQSRCGGHACALGVSVARAGRESNQPTSGRKNTKSEPSPSAA